MALHLVVSDSNSLNRISCYPESEEWSTNNLYPQFPKNFDSFEYMIICSVNGLLCLRCDVGEDHEKEYVLWNPSTGTFRLIPHPDLSYLPCSCSSSRCSKYDWRRCCGLGFDAESQDYKFVRFMMYEYEIGRNRETWHNCSEYVAVYSYKNNSWKHLPFPFDRDDSIRPIDKFSRVATGFLYWTTSRDVILSFDLSSDSFSILPYPVEITRVFSIIEEDSFEDDELLLELDGSRFSIKDNVFLLELDGSLVLVITRQQSELDSESMKKKAKLFSFWVYEASSPSPSPWTRKTNLDVLATKIERPLWLGKKNKNNSNSLVLLLLGSNDALLEYNYSTRELKEIDQVHGTSFCGVVTVSPYVESNANIATENDDAAVDRISQLSDDIILTILSLLPALKEAASTSVLSTRWSDLWRRTPNLVFHHTDHLMLRDKHKYSKWVNSVVYSRKTLCSKEFNISFPLNYSTRRKLTKWLEFALSRGVEVLVLNLVGKRFILLEKTFRRKSKMLKSTNLTSLCLKCLEVSGEAIGLFLRNCPLLERLIIKYALLTSDLEVCSGMLKHLDIQYCRGQKSNGGKKSIKGYAPNLTYLRIESDQKLVWDYTQSFISSPLTTLEFTLHCPESLLEKGFPQMPTLRELIVTYYDYGCRILRAITSLIRALPYLEEFEIKQQHYKSKYFEKHGMEVVNNVERFCHGHLRVFKFTWFDAGDGNHMELMNYILDNCTALQKIILHKYAGDSRSHVAYWEYVKQLQSKLPSHIQLITT